MKYLTTLGLIVLCGGAISAQATPAGTKHGTGTGGATGSSAAVASARATLMDGKGNTVGEARLQETPHGVLLRIDLKDIAPGAHALHVHQVGKCDAPTFESAGGHYAPDGRKHGFHSTDGPHAGDLPNIDVPSSKALVAEHLVAHVTLRPGPRSLLDNDGSAIVVHAGPDDYRTDPSGGAGGRVACGVISGS